MLIVMDTCVDGRRPADNLCHSCSNIAHPRADIIKNMVIFTRDITVWDDISNFVLPADQSSLTPQYKRLQSQSVHKRVRAHFVL